MCQFVRSHAGTGMTSDLKTYPTMNRFILYAGLLAAAVTATGCRQAPTGNTDGDGTISPSFVQQYYDLSAIAVRQYFDYPYIQIMPETYETCSYSVPPSVRFKALSEKYGDTAYNRPARSVQPYGILQRIFGNRHLQRQGFRCRPSGRSLPLGHRAHRGRLALPVYPERLYGSVRLEGTARRLPDRERNLISGGIPAGERDALRTRCGGDVYARPFRTIPEIHDSPRDKKTHDYRRPAGTGNGDNGKYGNHFPIEITHPSERLWLPICRRKGKKPIFVERQSLKNTGL